MSLIAAEPYDSVRKLAEALLAVMRLAKALARSGRMVDIAGLDRDVGQVCARALGLPIAQGHAMRALLLSLIGELDALTASLVANGCRPGQADDRAGAGASGIAAAWRRP